MLHLSLQFKPLQMLFVPSYSTVVDCNTYPNLRSARVDIENRSAILLEKQIDACRVLGFILLPILRHFMSDQVAGACFNAPKMIKHLVSAKDFQ